MSTLDDDRDSSHDSIDPDSGNMEELVQAVGKVKDEAQKIKKSFTVVEEILRKLIPKRKSAEEYGDFVTYWQRWCDLSRVSSQNRRCHEFSNSHPNKDIRRAYPEF